MDSLKRIKRFPMPHMKKMNASLGISHTESMVRIHGGIWICTGRCDGIRVQLRQVSRGPSGLVQYGAVRNEPLIGPTMVVIPADGRIPGFSGIGIERRLPIEVCNSAMDIEPGEIAVERQSSGDGVEVGILHGDVRAEPPALPFVALPPAEQIGGTEADGDLRLHPFGGAVRLGMHHMLVFHQPHGPDDGGSAIKPRGLRGPRAGTHNPSFSSRLIRVRGRPMPPFLGGCKKYIYAGARVYLPTRPDDLAVVFALVTFSRVSMFISVHSTSWRPW